MLVNNWDNKIKATGPDKMAGILQSILKAESEIDRDKEHVWVIGLKANNVIKYIELVTLGLLDSSPVHPREVFRLAISQGVNAIILAHNHPSGNIEPSPSDHIVTGKIKKAGEILDIKMLDHIIIGETGYHSFKEDSPQNF